MPIDCVLQTMERYLSAVVLESLLVLSVTKVCCVVRSHCISPRFVLELCSNSQQNISYRERYRPDTVAVAEIHKYLSNNSSVHEL